MSGIDVGMISLGPPSARLRSGFDRAPLIEQAHLEQALLKEGFSVLSGGCVLAEEDQLATNSSLMRQHVHNLVEHGAGAWILHLTPGSRGGDVAELIRYIEREGKAPVRLIVYTSGSAATQPALLRCTEILDRGAVPFVLVTGAPEDTATLRRLGMAIRLQRARRGARPRVAHVAELLKRRKGILVGGTFARDSGISLDADSLMHALGINVEELPLLAVTERAALITGGAVKIDDAPDPRLRAAARALATPSLHPLADYFALHDLIREREGHFAVLDDAGSPRLEFARAWLGNDVAPDGHRKVVVPTAGHQDGENGVAQLALNLLSEGVTGFATIASVSEDAVSFCTPGGGPPAFIDQRQSLGATATGHPVTVVALTRFRQRYRFHGFETETLPAAVSEDAWTLRVRSPEPPEAFLRTWPGAFAVIAHGHHSARIAELAHALSLGFRVRDHHGQLLYRPL